MIPLVDAHHDIWRQADLAWLQGPPQPRIFGEYGAIRRDYPIEEYMGEARAAGVERSVYVQTNWPPGREVEEVAWVQSVADRHGFPHAIVGHADPAAASLETTRACTVDLWGPVIRETVELFGPERCMFGSNFPVEKLWTTYDEVVRVTAEGLAGLSAAEQRAVLHDTADRVYRLGS